MLWSLLGIMVPTDGGTLPLAAGDMVTFIAVATLIGFVFTGVIGWVANAILRRRVATTDRQVFPSWPPSRTWKPCVRCNTPVQPNASFCPNCGASDAPHQ